MHPIIKTFYLIVSAALFLPCRAALDSAEMELFYIQHEQKYRKEYCDCTGDTAETNIRKIIAWRRHINEIADSPAYRYLLRDYLRIMGPDSDTRPCIVVKWQDERMKKLAMEDETANKQIHGADDMMVDSMIISEEADHRPSSPFDFGRIPFGTRKAAFIRLFKREYGVTPQDRETYCLVPDFSFAGDACMAAFHFSKNGLYYKYEIEGIDYHPDSLNYVIRPQAGRMVEELEKRLGPPDHRPRVGYFDIKPGQLAPIARWYQKPYIAFVGFSADRHRYYAKTIVYKEGVE